MNNILPLEEDSEGVAARRKRKNIVVIKLTISMTQKISNMGKQFLQEFFYIYIHNSNKEEKKKLKWERRKKRSKLNC